MRSLPSFSVLVSALLVAASQAKTAEDWRSRTVYKILIDRFSPTADTTAPCWDLSNYCGGTWRGLQNHLDYLTNMGIDAIWISPIVKNTPGGYHGYWLQDLWQVNPHFGTEDDLISLINAAHEKGMYVMLDVVANHVGPVGYDYRSIAQFNQQYHYHDCNGCPASCDIEDFQNQYQVEHCRLSGLPDLDQTNDYVQKTLLDWVRNTVQKYKFDGIRIDTVPEVPKWFWEKFAAAAGVFQIGEVFDGRMQYVASYQPTLTSVLSYPMYFTVKDVFAHRHSMYKLRYTLQSYESTFHDTSVLGSFLDNHDNARFLSFQPDHALYKAALAFTLHATGMPILYYGTEQGFSGGNDPRNREPLWQTGFNTNAPLYVFLKKTIEARKKYQVWKHQQVERYVDDQFFAFTRGNVFVALTNVGSGGGTVRRQITYHPYTPGTRLCNIYWPTDCLQVNHAGFSVVLNHGETKIFVPA